MIKRLIIATILILPSLCADSAYLRIPGTGYCTVTNATNATPIRITVSSLSACGITTNGQTIIVVEIGGNTRANIHLDDATDTKNLLRIVSGINTGTNSFDILDGSSGNVAGNGVYTNGGRVGLVANQTLQAHPRVFIDGPSGTIATSIADTGTGGRANASNIAFQTLTDASTNSSQSVWPVLTPGFYTDKTGTRGAGSALYYMATGDTTARDRALVSLRNIHQVLPTTACDLTKTQCGAPGSSFADWPLQYMEHFAVNYSISRSLLTSGEKLYIADYVLSDYAWQSGGNDYSGVSRTIKPWKVWGNHGTISISGSAVTGTGTTFVTDGIAAGDIVMQWAGNNGSTDSWQVASVTDETHLTLTRTNSGWDTNTLNYSNINYQVGEQWSTGQYGWLWMQKNYGYSLFCGNAATVNEGYIRDCPTYSAGSGNSTAGSHNLTLSRLQGMLAIGLALCGDDPRACLLLQLANEYWVDMALPRALVLYAGNSQSNPGYHEGRQVGVNAFANALFKMGVNPGIDYMSSASIFTNDPLHHLSHAMRLSDGNWYMTPNAEGGSYVILPDRIDGTIGALFMYPTHSYSKQFMDWLINVMGYTKNWAKYNGQYEYIWKIFLMIDPAIVPATAPTKSIFHSTDRTLCVSIYGTGPCVDGQGRFSAYSHSSWSNDQSYLAFNLGSWKCLDHCAEYDAPGWFLLAKNGKVLFGGDRSDYFGYRDNSVTADNRGYIELGGTMSNIKGYPDTATSAPVWGAAVTDYMVSKTDLTAAYKPSANPSAIYREMMDITSPGGQNYIFDHISASVSSAAQLRTLYHSYLNSCGTPSSTSCVTLTGGSTNTVSNIQTSPSAVVLTKVLALNGGTIKLKTSNGVNTDGSYPSGGGKTFRWEVCPSTDGGGSCNTAQTSYEFVSVHLPSTNTSEAYPTYTQTSSGSWRIVEVSHANGSAVAMMTLGSTKSNNASFTSTHAGTARYVGSGWTAGVYNWTLGGSPIAGCQGVTVTDGNNTMSCTSTAGAIAVALASTPSITTASPLPNGTVGVAYSQALAAIGGTAPYTWSQPAGTMCPGLTLNSNGTITGTPTTAQTCSFDARVTDSLTVSDTKTFQITIDAVVTPGSAIRGPVVIRGPFRLP